MTTTDTLIARLESAAEGSRELDFGIAQAIGLARAHPETDRSEWAEALIDGKWTYLGAEGQWKLDWWLPLYTTSIDAALTLVPEGWRVNTLAQHENGWACLLYRGEWNEPGRAVMASPVLATPALAICAAALKARQR